MSVHHLDFDAEFADILRSKQEYAGQFSDSELTGVARKGLAKHLLGVNRVLIMPHADCRMACAEETEMHEAILAASGLDSRGIEIGTVPDQFGALKLDVNRVRAYPLLSKTLVVGGAIFDVHAGRFIPQAI